MEPKKKQVPKPNSQLQKIFLMRKDDHLSNEEIAKELHISVKTVNKHIQLAIRQMKPFFAQILS